MSLPVILRGALQTLETFLRRDLCVLFAQKDNAEAFFQTLPHQRLQPRAKIVEDRNIVTIR
jgi:hypothetical protein